MIYPLDREGYSSVAPLFEPLSFHMCTAAALGGHNWGRIYVDDPASPSAAFAFCAEGTYLAGDSGNPGFRRDLRQALFVDRILGPEGTLCFALSSDDWVEPLTDICHPRPVTPEPRRHYVCRESAFAWRDRVPSGVEVSAIDLSFLSDGALRVPDHIRGWIGFNWLSPEAFVRDGFGYACTRGDEVVSWCLADCITGDAAEIGIHTAEGHRRMGLASVAAAATVEHALSRGLEFVGWHCAFDNEGSIRTAERVGFELERCYTGYYVSLG